jgi:hypothetical protein
MYYYAAAPSGYDTLSAGRQQLSFTPLFSFTD